MTTSTRQILNIMKALDSSTVDKTTTNTASPLTKPPAIPIPGKPQEMKDVLANFLTSEKNPGNVPR